MGMTPGEWHAQSAFAGAEILSEDGMLIADVFTREDAAAIEQLPALVAFLKALANPAKHELILPRIQDQARALLRAMGEG